MKEGEEKEEEQKKKRSGGGRGVEEEEQRRGEEDKRRRRKSRGGEEEEEESLRTVTLIQQQQVDAPLKLYTEQGATSPLQAGWLDCSTGLWCKSEWPSSPPTHTHTQRCLKFGHMWTPSPTYTHTPTHPHTHTPTHMHTHILHAEPPCQLVGSCL